MNEENNLPNSEFEEIVSGVGSQEQERLTVWDAFEQAWSQVMPGTVLTKGIAIVEFIGADGKGLRWTSSPDVASWDALGMLGEAEQDVRSQNLALMLSAQDMCWDDEDEGTVIGDDDEDFGDQ